MTFQIIVLYEDKISSINFGQASASTITGLLLYSKFSEVFVLDLGRRTIVGGDPKGTSESEDNLRVEVSFDTSTPGSRHI